MIFSGIKLREALIKERAHQLKLIDQAKSILADSTRKDEEVLDRLKSSVEENVNLNPGLIDENIFSLSEIRTICIRYRLRFLESTFFKPEYPYSSIAEIKTFERKFGAEVKSFHIIAPSKAFELENINKDPLLFARLNKNSYYLIHQWGKDLAWYRRFVAWPLQNFKTLLITLGILCVLFAIAIPSSIMHIFSVQSEIYLRIWLTVHTFIGLIGIALWIGLAFDKTFSSLNWNSKYYNY